MVGHAYRGASYRRAGLFLCALLLVLAYLFAKPEPAPGGITPPPVLDTCDIVLSNCATVRIDLVGNGSGTVISSPEGINCTVVAGVESGTCVWSFIFSADRLDVTLTYTPAAGSLVAFAGTLPGPGTCGFTVFDGDNFVSPCEGLRFVLTRHNVVVRKTGVGTGRVTSAPAGIDCTNACSREFDYGTQLALTATPDAGAVFKAWTGACAGQGATCNLTIQAATETNVVFELPEAQGGGGGGGSGSSGNTIGASTGGVAGATTSGKADKTVMASVVRTRSSKSPLGKRIVQLELNLEENASATLTLLRNKKTLLSKQLTRIRPGNRLLTLVIPKRVGKGKATLVFKLKDPAGNTLSGRRAIKIAAL